MIVIALCLEEFTNFSFKTIKREEKANKGIIMLIMTLPMKIVFIISFSINAFIPSHSNKDRTITKHEMASMRFFLLTMFIPATIKSSMDMKDEMLSIFIPYKRLIGK
ncbi:MAG: hypothetical protein J7J36_05895 [Thermoplasmata archaeon]|nr:hypothetical protein [Thermoplasmata archaeon]